MKLCVLITHQMSSGSSNRTFILSSKGIFTKLNMVIFYTFKKLATKAWHGIAANCYDFTNSAVYKVFTLAAACGSVYENAHILTHD